MAKTPKPVRRKNKRREIALKTKGVFYENVPDLRLSVDGQTYIFGNLTTFRASTFEEKK